MQLPANTGLLWLAKLKDGSLCSSRTFPIPLMKCYRMFSWKGFWQEQVSRAARLSAALIWLYRPPAPPRFFTISALRIAINFRFEVCYGVLCAEKNCENRELIALHRTFLWAIPRTLKVRYFFFFQRTKNVQRTVISDAKLRLHVCSESFPLLKWAMGVSIPPFRAELEVREVQKVAKKHVFRSFHPRL